MDKYLKALEEIERLLFRRGNKSNHEILDAIQEELNELKHCPECDEWIEFSDRFCRKCGHQIGVDE